MREAKSTHTAAFDNIAFSSTAVTEKSARRADTFAQGMSLLNKKSVKHVKQQQSYKIRARGAPMFLF